MSEANHDAPRMDWGESRGDLQSRLKWTDLNSVRPNEGSFVHIRGNGNVSSGVYQSGHYEWWRRLADDPQALVEWAYTSPLMEIMAARARSVA